MLSKNDKKALLNPALKTGSKSGSLSSEYSSLKLETSKSRSYKQMPGPSPYKHKPRPETHVSNLKQRSSNQGTKLKLDASLKLKAICEPQDRKSSTKERGPHFRNETRPSKRTQDADLM